MSWKNLLVCGGLVCLLAVPAVAQPTMSVTSSYNAGLGLIEWQVTITPSGGYTGALAIEAPYVLTGYTAGYDPTLRANASTAQGTHDAGDNNGAPGETWYYNVDTDGTTLLWNTKQLATDIEQNNGANPFTGGFTQGLWMSTDDNQVYAALGSDVNMPQPIKTLQIASNDGLLSWTDLLIEESGAPGTSTLLTGAATSVTRIDMNADGVISGADIQPVIDVLNGLVATAYDPLYPGLDGVARADGNNDGIVSGADIQPAIDCLNGIVCPVTSPPNGAGAGSALAASVVPEPASAALFVLGSLAFAVIRRKRRS